MPCILAYAVGVHRPAVHRIAWRVGGGVCWGAVVVFPLGCPWHHIVGSCGGGVVSCAGVDGLYEALPFRQCRAFFLKCRCGWAGWVSAWAGASLCGCCAVGGVCILCRSVVPVVVVRGVSCGAVRGLSRGLLRVCYTKGLQGLLNALYGAFSCPAVMCPQGLLNAL